MKWRDALFGWLLAVAALGVAAQEMEQSITLNPGWNAVYMEVQPVPSDSDSVFRGLPVDSVWMWNRPGKVVDFVDDPTELVPGKPEWLTYLPPEHADIAVRDLLEVQGGRPLLIHSTSNQAVVWRVRGQPLVPTFPWVSDSYNLVGFPLSAQSSHTFASLLGANRALASLTILRLDAGGRWVSVGSPQTERVEPGRAYWVYSRGASDFKGTLEVATDQGSRMMFGVGGVLNAIRLGNPASVPMTYRLELSPAEPSAGVVGGVPLRYRSFQVDAVTGSGLIDWVDWSQPMEIVVPAGEAMSISVEARRSALTGAPASGPREYHSLITISDQQGYRTVLPVSMTAYGSGLTGSGSRGAALAAGGEVHPQAGLWVGNVTLREVNFSASPSDPLALKPAKSEFDFRILVHVDSAGQSRLLQQAMVGWVRTNSPAEPTPLGRLAVFTDEAAASRLSLVGVSLRNNQPVIRRFTAPAFSFRQPIPMAAQSGGFGVGTLRCGTEVGYNDPLNPFKHVWHPDHDNLDPSRAGVVFDEGVESFSIRRQIELEFEAEDPASSSGLNEPYVPGYGDTRLGGRYRERIDGVHRYPILMGGTFVLQRATRSGRLNDGDTN